MRLYTVTFQDGSRFETKNTIVYIKIEDGFLKAYHSYNMEPEIIKLKDIKTISIS